MKKLYNSLLNKSNWLLAGILSLLGYASCDEVSPDNVMYGCPSAIFTVKGKVTNESGMPVPQIQLRIPHQKTAGTDTLYSDAEGLFTYPTDLVSPHDTKLTIISTDIDGSENKGSFRPDTTIVSVKRTEFTGGDGKWNQGSANKNITITLKEE